MDMVWSWEVHLKSGKMILKTIFPWYVCPSFLVSAWFLGQCYWHRMIVKQAWLSDCHRSNEHHWMMSWETISQNIQVSIPLSIIYFNSIGYIDIIGIWWDNSWGSRASQFRFAELGWFLESFGRSFWTCKKISGNGNQMDFGASSSRVGDLFQGYFGGDMRMINHHVF